MPKSSGQDLKTVQLAPSRSPPKARDILRFDAPTGAKQRPMTPGAAKRSDALDQRDPCGGIDPDQH
jgi:hypothetical protein